MVCPAWTGDPRMPASSPRDRLELPQPRSPPPAENSKTRYWDLPHKGQESLEVYLSLYGDLG
eukprot:14470383-Heterocapsa_arctica.AAC.1